MALIFVIVKKVINHHVTKWAWLNYNHSAVLRWRSSTVSQGWWPCCFYSPARPPSVGQTIAIRASLAATEASLIYPRCLTTRKRPHPDRSNTVNIAAGIGKPYDLLLDQERVGELRCIPNEPHTTCTFVYSAEDVTVDQFRAPAQHMNTQGQDHGWSTWVHLLVRPLQRIQPMSRPDWTCGRRHCREQVTIHHMTL